MSIREIPRSFEYQCDGCPQTHVQEGAGGHYTNSTPPNWLTIIIRPGESGRGGTEKLLCPDCKKLLIVPGFTTPQASILRSE